MSSLFEIFDSRQSVEHTLLSSTLGHDSCHFVNLLIIFLLICKYSKECMTLVHHRDVFFCDDGRMLLKIWSNSILVECKENETCG